MLSNHLHSQTDLLCQEAAKQCPLLSGLHEEKQIRGFEVSNFYLRAATVSAGFNVKGSCDKSPEKYTPLT